MDRFKTDDYHRLYDVLKSGVCIVAQDQDETILFANKGLFAFYDCHSERAFFELTGGRFAGMRLNERESLAAIAGDQRDFNLHFSFMTVRRHIREADASVKKAVLQGRPVYIVEMISRRILMADTEPDRLTGFLAPKIFFQKAEDLAKINLERDTFTQQFCPVCFNVANFRGFNRNNGMAEGDKALAFIAQTLREVFPDGLYSHINADTFYAVLPRKRLARKVDEVCVKVNRYLGKKSYALKAGLVIYNQPATMAEILHSFDMAKLACDEAKNRDGRPYVVFSREIQARAELRDFILKAFEPAMENGQIKMAYEPVLRLLSGKINGIKASVVWEDPEKGTIPPEVFWPVLEEARLSGRLDLFVMDRVLQIQAERQQNGLLVIPVIFSISRLGMELMRPLEHLETVRETYGLPRQCVRIEFSERFMNESSSTIHREVDRFREVGYEIWVDHFGTKNLSNAVLYEDRFDLIELDRRFLDPLDEKRKTIITDVVKMAKHLGVHTLAKGVATEEEVDFLKKAGCENIRGPYVRKPGNHADVFNTLAQKGWTEERGWEAAVYQAAGLVDIVSEAPLALFLADNGKIRMLTMNAAYLAAAQKIGITSAAKVADFFKDQGRLFPERFAQFAEKAYGAPQKLTYFVANHQYVQLETSFVAGIPEFWVGQAKLSHISADRTDWRPDRFDYTFRNAVMLFDEVFYIDMEKDEIKVIVSTDQRLSAGQTVKGIREVFGTFCQRDIHPDDRALFLSFAETDTLVQRLRAAHQGRAEIIIRVRQKDGAYCRMVCRAALVVDAERTKVVLCAWQDRLEQRGAAPAVSAGAGAQGHKQTSAYRLFQAILGDSKLPLFWKDTALQYVGASRAFLDLARVDTEAELIGKTAESFNWYTNPKAAEQAERRVIGEGKTVAAARRHVLVGGREQVIRVTEFPYYDEGGSAIAGVAGWIRQEGGEEAHRDDRTGLMNAAGILAAGFAFDDALRQSGRGYGAVILVIRNAAALRQTFGQAFVDKAEKAVANRIADGRLPSGVAAARIRDGYFLLLGKDRAMLKLEKWSIQMVEDIQALRQIDGLPCQIELNRAIGSGGEAKGFLNLLEILMRRAEQWRQSGDFLFSEVWETAGVKSDVLNDLSEPAFIVDPAMRQLLFVNKAMKQSAGLPEDADFVGRSCFELRGKTQPCLGCEMQRAANEQYDTYENQWHDAIGRTFSVKNIPVLWRGRSARLILGEPVVISDNEQTTKNAILEAERWGNAAIAIGLGEPDIEVGIAKCIAYIAQNLHAERFFIFETRGSREATCSYEWKEAGRLPLKGELQSVLTQNLGALFKAFEAQKVVLAADYAAFQREHPGFSLPVAGVQNFVAGQLLQAGRPVGFTLLTNLAAKSFEPAGYMLDTLTDFFAVMIRIRNNLRDAEEQGRRDHMTGVLNRRGFKHYIAESHFAGPQVFLSCDINGLKTVNDTQGHEAGDQLIQNASAILVRHGDRDHVFRMGGDEFLVVREGMDEGGARQIVQAIKNDARRAGFTISIGYVVHTGPIDDLDTVMRDADRAMYADKGRTHRRRRTDPQD